MGVFETTNQFMVSEWSEWCYGNILIIHWHPLFLGFRSQFMGNPNLASYENQHDMIFNSRQCKDPCLTPASGLWIHPGRQHTNVSGMDNMIIIPALWFIPYFVEHEQQVTSYFGVIRLPDSWLRPSSVVKLIFWSWPTLFPFKHQYQGSQWPHCSWCLDQGASSSSRYFETTIWTGPKILKMSPALVKRKCLKQHNSHTGHNGWPKACRKPLSSPCHTWRTW